MVVEVVVVVVESYIAHRYGEHGKLLESRQYVL